MANLKELNRRIDYDGIKHVVIAYKMGISRTTLWSRLKGESEFTTDEEKDLSNILHLDEKERKRIFD